MKKHATLHEKLIGRTITNIQYGQGDESFVIILDNSSVFSVGYSADEGEARFDGISISLQKVFKRKKPK